MHAADSFMNVNVTAVELRGLMGGSGRGQLHEMP